MPALDLNLIQFRSTVRTTLFRDEQARGTSATSLSDKITVERQNETYDVCTHRYKHTTSVCRSQTRSASPRHSGFRSDAVKKGHLTPEAKFSIRFRLSR